MAVVDLFNGFNKFLDGLRVESDLKPMKGYTEMLKNNLRKE